MNLIKKLSWTFALILVVGPIPGCALFDRHKKNDEGYYPAHYRACGPIALEKAINAAYSNRGIKFVKNPAPRRRLSQEIQKEGMTSRELLSYFDKNAIQITWPSEIKKIVNQHGFDIVTVNNINSLDPEKDIAIVLIHGKFLSKQYHWVVYPIDDVKNFYGEKTVIDAVYLLKWKGE